MHKLKYMHRDIKSLNVFLDGDMVAKVADFGEFGHLALCTSSLHLRACRRRGLRFVGDLRWEVCDEG